MSDAEKAVDDVRRIERLLKAETGLRVIASSDAEVRGIYKFDIYSTIANISDNSKRISLNSLTTKKQTTKFLSSDFVKKMLIPSYIILRIKN